MKNLIKILAVPVVLLGGAAIVVNIPSGNEKTIMQLCNKKIKYNRQVLPPCIFIADIGADYKSGGPEIEDPEKRAEKEKTITDLSTACGFEVSELSWACCPHCLEWDNGCPPCSLLCNKYGNDWPGHESECSVEP